MSVLKIYKYPHKILTKKLSPVVKFDSELRTIVRDMFETMYYYNGIGLAANQVGIDAQIIVIDIKEKNFSPLVVINPKILSYSKEKIVAEEGCLSFPGYFEKIPRSAVVTVEYYDITNKKHIITRDGLLARVLQHEIDHVYGIQFIQRMYLLKRTKFYATYFFSLRTRWAKL